jgi:sugar/nucleoside kinase (ribokinase family)
VSVDVACADPAFLDLTFVGLDAVPAPGEERFARDLVRSPGGAASTAIGAARLGLRAAVASPLGEDEDGDRLRSALAAEGVEWIPRRVARTAVTAVMPVGGERAMATFDPIAPARRGDVAALSPRALVASLGRLDVAPPGTALYAACGDLEARTGATLAGLDAARALVVNEREAQLLTGDPTAQAAASRLAGHVPCAIVTRGAAGAVAAAGGRLLEVEGVPVEAVDTTGAGDLFLAAYVWADLAGASLEIRLRWAVLYAALSVRAPTAVGGAVQTGELLEAGRRLGLDPPARVAARTAPRR